MSTRTKEKTRITSKVKKREKIKPPKQFRVMLLNNDVTSPMAVVKVLKNIFKLNDARAMDVMLYCHRNGQSQCYNGTEKECNDKVELARAYCITEHAKDPMENFNLNVLEFNVEEL